MLKTIWLAFLGLAFLVSCTPKNETVQPVLLQGKTMGTTYSVKLFPTQDDLNQINLYEAVDKELVRINQLMSTYIPNSELSQFNQLDAGQEFVFSDNNIEILNKAAKIFQESNGAFDVTVGPIVNLWGFGPDGRIDKRPANEEIIKAKSIVGFDKLVRKGNVVIKPHQDMYVDFSSIAKGYAVDKIAELLEQQHISNYLVEIGGEMRLSGMKPNGDKWKVAVEKPVSNRREAQLIFTPGNLGMATSGDYRNYFEQDGVRFSHTIDPETGSPITHKLASVTVLHPSAASADAYATALEVLGPVKGVEFAEQHQLSAYFLIKTDEGFAEVLSTEFQKLIN